MQGGGVTKLNGLWFCLLLTPFYSTQFLKNYIYTDTGPELAGKECLWLGCPGGVLSPREGQADKRPQLFALPVPCLTPSSLQDPDLSGPLLPHSSVSQQPLRPTQLSLRPGSGLGTPTCSCSLCGGGYCGPAPPPKPRIKEALPGDSSPRLGGGQLGPSQEQVSAQNHPEPLRPCLHSPQVCQPKGTRAGYCPYSHSVARWDSPGYFPTGIKSSETEQCVCHCHGWLGNGGVRAGQGCRGGGVRARCGIREARLGLWWYYGQDTSLLRLSFLSC